VSMPLCPKNSIVAIRSSAPSSRVNG